MPETVDWRNPFTAQTVAAMPVALARRLDELAAAGRHYPERARVREQVTALADVFYRRRAVTRAVDAQHEVDDGLVNASTDRHDELERHAATMRGLRDIDVGYAVVAAGCSVAEVALAGAVTEADVERAARLFEGPPPNRTPPHR